RQGILVIVDRVGFIALPLVAVSEAEENRRVDGIELLSEAQFFNGCVELIQAVKGAGQTDTGGEVSFITGQHCSKEALRPSRVIISQDQRPEPYGRAQISGLIGDDLLERLDALVRRRPQQRRKRADKPGD